MHLFDASSIIYAWDNYPAGQFPGLWSWMHAEFIKGSFCMLDVAFGEVEKRAPDCATWLKSAQLQQLSTGNEVLVNAMHIKDALEIVDDNYHPNGVGENDILIISAAQVNDCILISDESKQPLLPTPKARYKMPATSDLVGVRCINYLEMLKESQIIF